MHVVEKARSNVKRIGVVVLLLGLWGAAVPFVGPTFGYDMGGTPAWTWTEGRFSQHLLPGIAAVLGGSLLLRHRDAAMQRIGAGVATLGGIGFLVLPALHPLWAGQSMGGMSMGGSALSSALTSLGYHYGTGAAICALAAYAWGLLSASREADADLTRTANEPGAAVARDPSLVDVNR